MNVRKYRNNTYFRPIKLMVKNQSGNNATWRGERYKFLDGFQRTENISTPNSNSLRLDCFSINGTPLFTHTPNAHTGTIRWGCPFDETTSMTESLNNTTLASTMNDTDTIGI
jgi:hypothetical protein